MVEDITVARWGLASMLLIGVFMCGIFLCWLHERDIHILRPILGFFASSGRRSGRRADVCLRIYEIWRDESDERGSNRSGGRLRVLLCVAG